MLIEKAEILKIKLDLKAPFRTSFGVLSQREIILLKLYDKSGIIGLGESANLEIPIYEPEFNNGTIALLEQYLLPGLLHKNIANIAELESFYSHIRGNNFAKVAIESAFWHIEMQKTGRPLYELWGGTQTGVPAAISIGLAGDLETSLAKVISYVNQYSPKRIKVKIMPGMDVDYIRGIRRRFPHLAIMVDANAAYSLNDLELFKALDELNLLMIEQPLSYNDIVDHASLQSRLRTPICLDESITSYELMKQALALKSCQVVNIKPQRVGGYWQAKLISELCGLHNVPVWCGGMIESGWGQLFNVNLATLPNFKYENDICLSEWYLQTDILLKPIPIQAGLIKITDLEDLFTIDEDKLKEHTINNIIIT